MRKCPYCAEEIEDQAAKCPYCGSTLTATPGTPASPEAEAPSATWSNTDVHFSHTGARYVLGYGPDYYGIWDRQSPTQPVQKFPRGDAGWRDAWLRYSALEPGAQPVAAGSSSPGAYAMTAAAGYGPAAGGPYGVPGAGTPGWGYGAPQAWVPQTRTNGMSIASLVLGIVGLIPFTFAIASILAIIFGFISKAEIDRSAGLQQGRGMAIAGIVTGFIGAGLFLLIIIVGAAGGFSS